MARLSPRLPKMKTENILMIIIVVLIVLIVVYWLFKSMKHRVHESFYTNETTPSRDSSVRRITI